MSRTEARGELWGTETRKAVANFPVSGEPIPAPVARWLGRIKAAAARANAELGLLAEDKAERIAAAGDRVARGELGRDVDQHGDAQPLAAVGGALRPDPQPAVAEAQEALGGRVGAGRANEGKLAGPEPPAIGV